MLSSCFFLIGIGFICKKKLQEDIPETAWKNTEVFLWSIDIFNNSKF